MRRDEIITRIRKHADAIRAEGATELYLFGSAARDQMREASDIDVFVECDPARSVSLLDIIGIKHIIEDDLGRRVDITTKDGLHPLLRNRILDGSGPSALMADEPRDARPPLVYLNDILVEIDFLKTATADVTFEQYLKSGEKRRAIERSLQIISEASRGISEADKALYPDIPWRRIQDLGNVIRHAYFGLEHARLWAIVRDDLAALESTIRLMQARHSNQSR